jgi:aspartate kinase
MKILVQKYGGSSVAGAARIKNVARRIVKATKQGYKLVVVVSAQGDTTDKLIEMAYKINPSPSDREMDMLLSTGEQVSISLLAMAIESLGVPVVSLTGGQVGIMTDESHKKARIMRINSSRLISELDSGKIVIVAGFQGINQNNDITTLGRGGSDTTAVALAIALGAERCEIYTDVDGVYTADPRKVKSTIKLKEISYDEMLEMASLGAKVLHPRSVELAKQYDITLEVKTSFKEVEGTVVKKVEEIENFHRVSGVTCDKTIAKIAVLDVPDEPGVAYKVFLDLAKANINVDMIIQSIHRDKINDISFTVSEDDLEKTLSILNDTVRDLGAKGIEYDKNVAKVSIVGIGIKEMSSVATTMFEVLSEKGINIQMISTSEIKISCLLDRSRADEAIEAIHERFITSGIEVTCEEVS